MALPLGKLIRQLLEKLDLSYDPELPFLGIYRKRIESPYKNLYTNVHSEKVKTIQFHQLMNG